MMSYKVKGFSLVELLVALVVASIGLLGVATLSLQATRYNLDAKLRHQATMLASDMADRIRANPENALTNYLTASVTAQDNSCDSAACTEAERAEQDIFEWNAMIANELPNGAGGIAVDTVDATKLEIEVSWDELAGNFVDTSIATTNPIPRDLTILVLP